MIRPSHYHGFLIKHRHRRNVTSHHFTSFLFTYFHFFGSYQLKGKYNIHMYTYPTTQHFPSFLFTSLHFSLSLLLSIEGNKSSLLSPLWLFSLLWIASFLWIFSLNNFQFFDLVTSFTIPTSSQQHFFSLNIIQLPGSATCNSWKLGHQMVPLVFLANLANMWCHLQ